MQVIHLRKYVFPWSIFSKWLEKLIVKFRIIVKLMVFRIQQDPFRGKMLAEFARPGPGYDILIHDEAL